MQPDLEEIDRIIATALAEDVGSGDITTQAVVPENAEVGFSFVSRQEMVVCGLSVLERLYIRQPEAIVFSFAAKEGQTLQAGSIIAQVEGNARVLLSTERVALNLLQHMSSIATLTAQYVKAVEGTGVSILDTRKTLPGLRVVEKYAVFTGGGTNHRMRLDDGVLIKDNHISICGGVAAAVREAKQRITEMKIEVECDTLAQVQEALEAGADSILLDNMDIKTLKQAVAIAKGRAVLEASGGITLQNIRAIAATGVEYISVGALTHSAPSVDIGLDRI